MMKKFEKLGMEKFKGTEINQGMVLQVKGGGTTGGGFSLIGSTTVVIDGEQCQKNVYFSYDSDVTDRCGVVTKHIGGKISEGNPYNCGPIA